MCNQNNLTQSLREKPRRGLIHVFLYLFSSILPLRCLVLLPLLYFFKKLVCYAPTHFFAWLCSTLQIIHTHTLSRTPREHCTTTTTPIKTLHLFDKTSPSSQVVLTGFTLTNPPTLANYTLNLFHALTSTLSPQTFLSVWFYWSFFFSYFVFFYSFTLFDPFLSSFKFFNTRYNFPSISLDFFEVKLFIFQAPYGMLLVCVLSHNLFQLFLDQLLNLHFSFLFFKEKFKTSTFHNTTHTHMAGRSENSTLINLFASLHFFHLLLLLLSVVLFSNWNFNYF